MKPQFASFTEFYPYYLAQHRNRVSRTLHALGLIGAIGCLALFVCTGALTCALLAPVFGYGLGWFGHFMFERNKPAAWGYPLYSLFGDVRMTLDTLRGRW
jgi:hypothetical protein